MFYCNFYFIDFSIFYVKQVAFQLSSFDDDLRWNFVSLMHCVHLKMRYVKNSKVIFQTFEFAQKSKNQILMFLLLSKNNREDKSDLCHFSRPHITLAWCIKLLLNSIFLNNQYESIILQLMLKKRYSVRKIVTWVILLFLFYRMILQINMKEFCNRNAHYCFLRWNCLLCYKSELLESHLLNCFNETVLQSLDTFD